jgi:hypothetical protein
MDAQEIAIGWWPGRERRRHAAPGQVIPAKQVRWLARARDRLEHGQSEDPEAVS